MERACYVKCVGRRVGVVRAKISFFIYLGFFFFQIHYHNPYKYALLLTIMTISPESLPLQTLIKRDGRVVSFDAVKITDAIFNAAQAVGGKDRALAEQLAQKVLMHLQEEFKGRGKIPTVEHVQDCVEKVLIEEGHAKTAKAFILFRYKKGEERQRRALILGQKNSSDNLNFSNEALKILERRYLLKDELGQLIETPRGMVERVAKSIAKADGLYGVREENVLKTEKDFYEMLSSLRFLPNSPTLMNAGTKTQQLSSCFVLPIEDTMEGIFGTLKSAAIIHQRGSGTGFSFSRLRPKNDPVGQNISVAAGPVS